MTTPETGPAACPADVENTAVGGLANRIGLRARQAAHAAATAMAQERWDDARGLLEAATRYLAQRDAEALGESLR